MKGSSTGRSTRIFPGLSQRGQLPSAQGTERPSSKTTKCEYIPAPHAWRHQSWTGSSQLFVAPPRVYACIFLRRVHLAASRDAHPSLGSGPTTIFAKHVGQTLADAPLSIITHPAMRKSATTVVHGDDLDRVPNREHELATLIGFMVRNLVDSSVAWDAHVSTSSHAQCDRCMPHVYEALSVKIVCPSLLPCLCSWLRPWH